MVTGYHWSAGRLRRWTAAGRIAVTSRRAAGPPLTAGEHALLRKWTLIAALFMATQRALYHRTTSDPVWQRIAWIDVAAVEHSRSTPTLTLRRWPETDCPPIKLWSAPTPASPGRHTLTAAGRLGPCGAQQPGLGRRLNLSLRRRV